MVTINQKWARERNFAKFIVKGIQAKARVLLKGNVLTLTETDAVMNILSDAKRVLHKWEEKSVSSKGDYAGRVKK